MLDMEKTLLKLPEHHQVTLRWCATHADQVRSWRELISVSDWTPLVTQRGIHKPSGTEYALSVRESLEESHPDRAPKPRPNGTWSYDYYEQDPSRANSNSGLIKCMEDGIPVGVFRQVARTPASRYKILGLAAVVDWQDGFFHLEGFSPEGLAYEHRAEAEIDRLVQRHEAAVPGQWDDFEDGRDLSIAVVVREVVQRRGQLAFRRDLIEAYGGRCAISGCNAEAALEACHIRPYKGPRTNTLSNGLLLRADLHTLFDQGLLAVDTKSMTIIIAPELEGTTYETLTGKFVSVPERMPDDSNLEALDSHCRWAGLSTRACGHKG